MSDPPPPDLRRIRNRVLDLYVTVQVLMLLGIAVLIVYCFRLGPLTSPGAEQSFGIAVGLMFIMAAIVVHITDRTYRVWPLGRRFTPTPPGPVSTQAEVRFLKVLVIVLAGAAIAYILGTLIA